MRCRTAARLLTWPAGAGSGGQSAWGGEQAVGDRGAGGSTCRDQVSREVREGEVSERAGDEGREDSAPPAGEELLAGVQGRVAEEPLHALTILSTKCKTEVL
jgi:hypothetical protein